MARKSISQQLSELRTYCIKLENELDCTRQVGQENADLLRKAREHISQLEREANLAQDLLVASENELRRLKGSQKPTNRPQRPSRSMPAFVSLSSKAAAYCAFHGVRSCTKEQVLNWVP